MNIDASRRVERRKASDVRALIFSIFLHPLDNCTNIQLYAYDVYTDAQ